MNAARRPSLFMLLVNVCLIVIFLIIINTFAENRKTLTKQGIKYEFKYRSLPLNKGYTLFFSIKSSLPLNKGFNTDSDIKFFVKEKGKSSTLMEKSMTRPKSPGSENEGKDENKRPSLDLNFKCEFRDTLHLRPGEYVLGVETTVNRDLIYLSLPVTIRPVTGIKKLFRN